MSNPFARFFQSIGLSIGEKTLDLFETEVAGTISDAPQVVLSGELSSSNDGLAVIPASQATGWSITSNYAGVGETVIWNTVESTDNEGFVLAQKTGPSSFLNLSATYVFSNTTEYDVYSPAGTEVSFISSDDSGGFAGFSTSHPKFRNDIDGSLRLDYSVTNVDVWTFGTAAIALTPTAFASLPASPVFGMLACINNSNTATWGATIAGGGSNKVVGFYNGTNWTVFAK